MQQEQAGSRRRIELFDFCRGLAIIGMVLFHLFYDLRFVTPVAHMEWFNASFQTFLGIPVAWTFIFIAGCMCLMTKSNAKRAFKYLAIAFAIWLVTFVTRIDTPISFGIMFCMGTCTLIAAGLESIPFNRTSAAFIGSGVHFDRSNSATNVQSNNAPSREFRGLLPRGYVAAAILFILFLCLQGLQEGTVWMFGLNLRVPSELYSTPYLAWAGFPDASFASGDYYPLLPFVFLFFCGTACMARWRTIQAPNWLYVTIPAGLRWINVIGRYSLWIYILHQPVILAVLKLMGL